MSSAHERKCPEKRNMSAALRTGWGVLWASIPPDTFVFMQNHHGSFNTIEANVRNGVYGDAAKPYASMLYGLHRKVQYRKDARTSKRKQQVQSIDAAATIANQRVIISDLRSQNQQLMATITSLRLKATATAKKKKKKKTKKMRTRAVHIETITFYESCTPLK